MVGGGKTVGIILMIVGVVLLLVGGSGSLANPCRLADECWGCCSV
jgi:hypothetical protein